MGTAQQEIPVTTKSFLKVWIATAVAGALCIGALSYTTLQSLEAATRKQCLQHDWPVHADQLHKDWCLDNGYKI